MTVRVYNESDREQQAELRDELRNRSAIHDRLKLACAPPGVSPKKLEHATLDIEDVCRGSCPHPATCTTGTRSAPILALLPLDPHVEEHVGGKFGVDVFCRRACPRPALCTKDTGAAAVPVSREEVGAHDDKVGRIRPPEL